MEKNDTLSTKEIIQKRDLLTCAAIILKKEFFGIDSVIDQVIESISSWYLFPHMQKRPVVVNLWGMTGVGKSDLLQRLIQLLNLSDKFYDFDMSEIADGRTNLNNEFSIAYKAISNNPLILAFDEFQLARSIDEDANEKGQSKSRIVWDLIDTGKYKFIDYSHHINYLYEFLQKAVFVVRNGVKVRNGIVVQGLSLFKSEFNSDDISKAELKRNFMRRRNFFRKPKALQSNWENNKINYFIDHELLETIFDLYNDKIDRIAALRDYVLQLDEKETIDFIKEVIRYALCPKVVDLSKSVIFIIGNLDEAYKMAGDFNPDIDADSFYQETLKIGISEVKTALKKRFRKEQISRLGNTHIIYPSLNQEAFWKIIHKELKIIKEQFSTQFNIELHFHDSVVELIYREGVFPTQGTRPVLSTINQLIRSKIGLLAAETIEKKDICTDEIYWQYHQNKFVIDFMAKKKVQHKLELKLNLALSDRRTSKKDDLQSLVAVHESGHAIVSSLLLNYIPEKIVSITTNNDFLGFTYTQFNHKFYIKDEMISWIAMYLGGIAAEEVVFGENKISSGADDDINKATMFAARMIKNAGMYKLPIDVNVQNIQTNHSFFDLQGEYNQYLEHLIQQGKQKAIEVLQENMELLIAMANYLSDNTQLNKEQIKNLVEKYARSNISANKNSFRKILKNKVIEIEKSLSGENKSFIEHISLNKAE